MRYKRNQKMWRTTGRTSHRRFYSDTGASNGVGSLNTQAGATLEKLLRKYGMTPREALFAVGVSAHNGREMLAGRALFSRDLLLRLAFLAGFSLHDAQTLLRQSGKKALNPIVRRDSLLQYCLVHSYSLTGVQELLFNLGEEVL